MEVIMKQKHLQTVVSGCAWCKTVIDIKNHEVENFIQDKPMILSHGICIPCKDTFEKDSPETELTSA
jgi:hypothetical protein